MDTAQLVRMFEHIEKNNIPLHSLLIVRNGYLITEAYWNPYGPDNKHAIESITKSMIGTPIGIAIDQDEIRDIDQILFRIERTHFGSQEGLLCVTQYI